MEALALIDPLAVWEGALSARLPGSDPFARRNALFDTINEFLHLSTVWRSTSEIVLLQGISHYNIPLPRFDTTGELGFSGPSLLYTHLVALPGWCWVKPVDGLPCYGGWPQGSPYRAAVESPGRLAVFPTPDATFPDPDALPPSTNVPIGDVDDRAQGISCAGADFSTMGPADAKLASVLVSLKLATPILSVPKFLADYYYDPILYGAAHRMHSHIKRPYSDEKQAVLTGKRFRDGARQAKDEVLRRWSSAERSASFPPDWVNTPRS